MRSKAARTKVIELKKIDKFFEENLKVEGKTAKKYLDDIEQEYKDAKEYYDDEMSSLDSDSDKELENQKTNSDKNKAEQKQSPIDYVVEKQSCELPDIPESDGGD